MLIDSIGRIRPLLRFFFPQFFWQFSPWTTSWHHLASTRFRRCWCYPYTLQSMKSTTSVTKKLSLCHFFQIGFGMSPSVDLFLKKKHMENLDNFYLHRVSLCPFNKKLKKFHGDLGRLCSKGACLTDHQISSENAMTTRRGRSILLCVVLLGAPWESMESSVWYAKNAASFDALPCFFSYLFRTQLGGGFKYFLCSPVLGEDSHVD